LYFNAKLPLTNTLQFSKSCCQAIVNYFLRKSGYFELSFGRLCGGRFNNKASRSEACLLVPNVIGLSPFSSNSSQIIFAREKIDSWGNQEFKRHTSPLLANISEEIKPGKSTIPFIFV